MPHQGEQVAVGDGVVGGVLKRERKKASRRSGVFKSRSPPDHVSFYKYRMPEALAI